MAIKVTLRQKSITKGRKSLYLDFYPAIVVKGKSSRREFLGLYIIEKPKSPIDKVSNKQTLLLAEQIRLKRDNEINKPEIYNEFEKQQNEIKAKGELSFLAYFEKLMDKRTGSNYATWSTAYEYLKDFSKGNLKFSELTAPYCNDYKDYLLSTNSKRSKNKKLSQNTALSYFNKFKAVLKQAYEDELLQQDINRKVKGIEEAETSRIFLTKEELNKLANTECPNPLLKRAALFSALTGLRFSDIKKLTWSEVIYNEDLGYRIDFTQKKTKKIEYLPIPEQAYQLMGEPKEQMQEVFEGLNYSAHQNGILLKWAINAGVQKHLTFHCFRHTYATLQLEAGTDIYTVSKMLGHKELKTTQIYAKIVDETKRKATNKINIDFK